MRKGVRYRWLLLVGISFVCLGHSFAQSGFFVPNQGKLFFKGDSATIFSNVTNQGQLGIGKNSVLNFSGRRWDNDPGAQILDTFFGVGGSAGNGGLLRFIADNYTQQLNGGYNVAAQSGPVFSAVQLHNPHGVQLVQSSAKVSSRFDFSAGRVYLNDRIFVMGDKAPGLLSGYDSARYFVTNPSLQSGFLIREGVSANSGWVTFPIGSANHAYTPVAVKTKATRPDHFYANVFDSVRSSLFSGASLSKESVNKTWQVGKLLAPNEDDVEVRLQHLVRDEGSVFAASRSQTYISHYSNDKWNEGGPKTAPSAGSLTTGQMLTNSGLNTRSLTALIGSNSFFTKFALSASNLRTNLVFGAYRVGAFIVAVHWQTKPEINVKHFVVERRRTNETDFASIDTVRSLAVQGYSTGFLNYAINDSNSYKGISLYRLKIFDYANNSYYSEIVGVSGVNFSYVKLWPNPTADKFTILLSGRVAREVVVYNAKGQVLLREDVNNRNVITLSAGHLVPGGYFVSIISNSGAVISTEKLIVVR